MLRTGSRVSRIRSVSARRRLASEARPEVRMGVYKLVLRYPIRSFVVVISSATVFCSFVYPSDAVTTWSVCPQNPGQGILTLLGTLFSRLHQLFLIFFACKQCWPSLGVGDSHCVLTSTLL